MHFTRFHEDLTQLGTLNWDVIESPNWADTDDEPDRKRRRQAEFLIAEHVPSAAIRAIGVKDDGVAIRVAKILAESGAEHLPRILIEPGCYV